MKAKDVRKGQVILYNGSLFRILEARHHTPGNLRAMVQMKLRNLQSGAQLENRFGSADELDAVDLFNQQASYLYSDQNGYHFMNQETYEEVTLDEDLIGETKYFLQEGMMVNVSVYNEQPIGIELPQTVILTVAETEPGLRGATASNSPKPATTDTGLQISVPPFIKIGDKVVVNTETGEYQSRAES